MTHALLLSSGNGPGECRLALGHLVPHLTACAEAAGLELDCAVRPAKYGPVSAVIQVSGAGADAFAEGWEGVVLWRCTSPLRPRHKRRNWFVQIFPLDLPKRPGALDPSAIQFQTLRAGGPGGQHQNTTESAVRARWVAPSGEAYAVVVRSERSQHQNKRLALERLAQLITLEGETALAEAQGKIHALHHQLTRGAPRHVFKGPRFEPDG